MRKHKSEQLHLCLKITRYEYGISVQKTNNFTRKKGKKFMKMFRKRKVERAK